MAEQLAVIYGRNSSPISLIIQTRTRCRWSHVGAVVGENVIEAVGGQGVVVTPMALFKKRYTQTKTGFIYCVSKEQAIDYLQQRIGARYDKRSIYGILLCLGWDDIHAYQCAELIAGAAGTFPHRELCRKTPARLIRSTFFPGEQLYAN